MPARASALVEHAAKKRTITPPANRSGTPTSAAAAAAAAATTAVATAAATAPVVDEQPPPPQPLPKTIQSGKPLPTVEEPQVEDLSMQDFQTVQERQVDKRDRRARVRGLIV